MNEVNYYKADRLTIKEIKESLPSWIIPTLGTFYIFLALVGLVIVFNLFNFPFGQMIAGNPSIEVSFGFPWAFLKTDIMDSSKTQISFVSLISELLIFLLVAYILNVIKGIIFNELNVFSNKENSPTLYKTK